MIEFFSVAARLKTLLGVFGAVLALFVGSVAANIILSGKLDAERAGHAVTRKDRDTAVIDGTRWKTIAGAMLPKVGALQVSVRECLDREAMAGPAATERKGIMAAARPQARNAAEKEGVIDAATRKRAMDRLNRPLD